MILETERLILRPWEVRDAKDLYEYAKDPAVGPITGWPVHTSVRESRGILKNALMKPEIYAVTLKGNDHPIGSVGIINPARVEDVQPGEMEIGCWLGVPFWGQGYIPEAIGKLQEHAFEDLDCTALWYGWYDGNDKSDRCREKCGFTYHHTEKDKECLLMHDIRTEHFARLTREEWLQRERRGLCGFKCTECPSHEACPGCLATDGKPCGGKCHAAECVKKGGKSCLRATKEDLLREINALPVEGMPEITSLYELIGSYVNLEYPLPQGGTAKLLRDNVVYWGAQAEMTNGSGRCLGIVAGDDILLVAEYGENGADPYLRLYKRRG